MRYLLRTSVALVAALVLALALLPGVASAAHFGLADIDVDVTTETPDDDVSDIVADTVDVEATVTNLGDEPLDGTTVVVDLPDGVVFTGVDARTDEGVECLLPATGEANDVLCDVGTVEDSELIVLDATTTGRTASTITTVAYAIWEDFPAVYGRDNVVLASTTLQLDDAADETADQLTFAVRNTGDTTVADDVVVEIVLPEGEDDAEATISNSTGECFTPAEAGGNIVCSGLSVAPNPAADLENPLPIDLDQDVTVTVTNLEENAQDIIVEAKGTSTSRAALTYNADGTVADQEFHDPASRTVAGDAVGVNRSATAKFGVLLNDAIDLPATQFTPVGGTVSFDLNDEANTGQISTSWTEDGVTYDYTATTFRELDPSLAYFQDGGVNFDTHQHGQTLRPNGPGNIPDLWVQALVYSLGTLERTNADGTTDTFEDVAAHMMYRQASAGTDGEVFQHWAEKGVIPDRTATTDYGEPVPALPTDLTLVEMLFANTPDGTDCTSNGIAGSDCNTELGQFVKFLTFAQPSQTVGFNDSGIDLSTSNPSANTVTTRFRSFNQTANGLEGAESAGKLGMEVSQKTFATVGEPTDTRTDATYAVIGRDDVFADSLSGSALAGPNGPLLFSGPDALNPVVRSELRRVLAPGSTVYLLGGPAALSEDVEQELDDDGWTVERLAGETRLGTAAAVADEVRQLNPDATEQILVRAFDADGGDTSQAWADSVSAGAYAADQQIPVILTRSDELSTEAQEALDPAATTYVIGGTEAISDSAANDAPNAERISGETRVETSIEVARQLWERQAGAATDQWLFTDGEADIGWAYGLGASPFAAISDTPLILLPDTGIPTSVADYFDELGYSPTNAGTVAISSDEVTDYTAIELLELLNGGQFQSAPVEDPTADPAS